MISIRCVTSAVSGFVGVGVVEVDVATGASVGVATTTCVVGEAVGAVTGAGNGELVAHEGGVAVGVVVGAGVGEHVPVTQLHRDAPGV